MDFASAVILCFGSRQGLMTLFLMVQRQLPLRLEEGLAFV
jgi:hypothetical protein